MYNLNSPKIFVNKNSQAKHLDTVDDSGQDFCIEHENDLVTVFFSH